MKLIGEIFGGALFLAFLAFQARWLDAATISSFFASEHQAQAPNP